MSFLSHIQSFCTSPHKKLLELVLPASCYSKREISRFDHAVSLLFKKNTFFQRSQFRVGPDTTLDQVVFSKTPQTPPSEKKHVVYFLPNGMLWQESIDRIKTLQRIFSADVTCSNYRGCGKSQGVAETDTLLVNDGVKQVQALLEKGVKANNIVLYGYSLGGAVAICAARALEKQGHSVHVVSERSFRNISAVVQNAEELHIPIIGAVIAHAAACLVTPLGWSLNAEADLSHLRGKVFIIYNDNDDVIASLASLKKAVDEAKLSGKRLENVTIISMQDTKNRDGEHNRSWTKKEDAQITKELRQIW